MVGSQRDQRWLHQENFLAMEHQDIQWTHRVNSLHFSACNTLNSTWLHINSSPHIPGLPSSPENSLSQIFCRCMSTNMAYLIETCRCHTHSSQAMPLLAQTLHLCSSFYPVGHVEWRIQRLQVQTFLLWQNIGTGWRLKPVAVDGKGGISRSRWDVEDFPYCWRFLLKWQ